MQLPTPFNYFHLSFDYLSVNMRRRGRLVLLSDKSVQIIQTEVNDYISQFKEGYFSPLSMLARLTEEVGELAREINHYYGEKPKKESEKDNTIKSELGDVFFILVCFANSLEIDLESSYREVMEKYKTRDMNRWTPLTKE